jgi:hypothetical protein
LPEHVFLNAAAAGIIETRKHVILNDAPFQLLAFEIAKLASEPTLYANDLGVFLALDIAKSELRRAKPDNEKQVLAIEDLLWNAAIKIEEGDRPDAEKNLRAAEDALEKALKDPNTPASELARLTQNLKDAMNRDIQAMMDQMRKEQESGQKQQQQSDSGSKTVNQQDLNNQVDKMNQMAQSGSRDAAQDMLDYIKQLLENLKAGQNPNSKANEQAKKSMDALKDMAKKQRDMENGKSPNTMENQETLRKALGDAARELGESGNQIPQGMGKADKAMRNAEKALQRGAKGGAQADQEDAAGQLDDAAQSLSQQMSQDGEAQSGDGQDNGEDGKDPLGRTHMQSGHNRMKMPTERQLQRSRTILEELRRRASEHERPRQELDYLRRLLQEY